MGDTMPSIGSLTKLLVFAKLNFGVDNRWILWDCGKIWVPRQLLSIMLGTLGYSSCLKANYTL